MIQAPLTLRGHNPDVLSCIANLSNDEVFTPPEMADAMLDLVASAWADANNGESIWANPHVTFLDPFTKSGVFLREIVRRLTEGLATAIPDLEKRVDHILTKQVFGIGITELTALLARRSVYCSKHANGKHSIATSFDDEQGNIWFERTEHTWAGGKAQSTIDPATNEDVVVHIDRRCIYCGAGEDDYGRGDDLETHAYAFIHTNDIKARVAEIFGDTMQFDVIIGNPPYQLSDSGFGTSAAPIYQKFVEQAKQLDPRYLSLVIPSRWFAGGKGLDDFRETMLDDDRIRSIDDFLSASDVFPGVGLKGGVCYFLWDRDHPGACRVSTHLAGWETSVAERPLREAGSEVFIRFNQGLSILKKVAGLEGSKQGDVSIPSDRRFADLVSSRKPFGLTTTFKGRAARKEGDVTVFQNGGVGYIARTEISTGLNYIDGWKIFVGRAAPGTGNRDTYPHRIMSTPYVGPPGSNSWALRHRGRGELRSVLPQVPADPAAGPAAQAVPRHDEEGLQLRSDPDLGQGVD